MKPCREQTLARDRSAFREAFPQRPLENGRRFDEGKSDLAVT